MIKLTEIQGQGFDEQLNKFILEIRKTPYHGLVCRDMFLPNYHRDYTYLETIQAFQRLGVDMYKIKHKKWYQFWIDDEKMRFIEALKQIK